MDEMMNAPWLKCKDIDILTEDDKQRLAEFLDLKGDDKLPIGRTSEHITEKKENRMPMNDIEKKVATIWQDILKTDMVSVDDNFFAIGGNSILLIQLHSQLESVFPGKIQMTDLFESPTIAMITRLIDQDSASKEQIEIAGVKMQDEFLVPSGNQNENHMIALEIASEVIADLKRLMESMMVDQTSVLIATYIFLISECSMEDEITVHLMDENKLVYPIPINMKEIKNMDVLIREVSERIQRKESEKTYSLENLKGKNRQDNMVRFIVLKDGVKPSGFPLLELYDVIMEIQKSEEELSLFFEFQSDYLNGGEMKRFVSDYVEYIERVTAF
jgi:fengycin family lipopeptide synthetase D